MKTLTKSIILLSSAFILLVNNAEAKIKRTTRLYKNSDISKNENEIRTQILNKLDYPYYLLNNKNYEVGIIFKINELNKVELDHVICENAKISNYIKKELNEKKVDIHPTLVNKEYFINIKFKYIEL